jgi:hypothetical protein
VRGTGNAAEPAGGLAAELGENREELCRTGDDGLDVFVLGQLNNAVSVDRGPAGTDQFLGSLAASVLLCGQRTGTVVRLVSRRSSLIADW